MGHIDPAAAVLEIAWGGKLPGHGDFVWSTPRTQLRAQFEEWLHLGMLQGRSRYRDRWNQCLDQGFLWNFLLPARYNKNQTIIAGCIAPSHDRVGRRYPLFIVCALSVPVSPATKVLDAVPRLLAQLSVVLYTGIRRTWPRDALGNRLDAAVSAWQTEIARAPDPRSNQLDLLEIPILNHAPKSIPPPALSPWPDIASLLQKSHCPTLWWTSTATGAPLKTLAYEPGLEPALIPSLFSPQAGIPPRRA